MRGTIDMLEATVGGLQYELRMREIRLEEKDQHIAELQLQVEELKKQAARGDDCGGEGLPPFVKPNLARRRRRRPGRKEGHAAALRPVPVKIDQHQNVPLATNDRQQPIWPACRCRLS